LCCPPPGPSGPPCSTGISGYRIHVAKSVSMLDSESIHRRFGHCSEARRLKKMAGRCNGFPKVPAGFSHDPTSCDSCLAGGSKRTSASADVTLIVEGITCDDIPFDAIVTRLGGTRPDTEWRGGRTKGRRTDGTWAAPSRAKPLPPTASRRWGGSAHRL
jgi:hypothetical protein